MSKEQIIEILEQQLQLLSEFSTSGLDDINLAKTSDSMVKIAELIFAQTEKRGNSDQP